MRILHTADWHLGKKLNGAPRLDEQREALERIYQICIEYAVDAVLVCGDIYDNFVAPNEAETLFYRYALKLSEDGRAVIVLAGNHDDEKRLCAASPLAKTCGIVLAGGVDYSDIDTPLIKGFYGGIRIFKNGEQVNLALLPFPSDSRLQRFTEIDYSIDYAQRVKLFIEKLCQNVFDQNGTNILAAHAFLDGSNSSSERILGTAMVLPKSIIPKNTHYAALGHIHKPQTLGDNIRYSGSVLQYGYDEGKNQCVILLDCADGAVTQTAIALDCGKRLVKGSADNFEQALTLLNNNPDCYVHIIYSGEPLSKTQNDELKKHPSFNMLSVAPRLAVSSAVKNSHKSDLQLFCDYYRQLTEKDAPEDLTALFCELMETL